MDLYLYNNNNSMGFYRNSIDFLLFIQWLISNYGSRKRYYRFDNINYNYPG